MPLFIFWSASNPKCVPRCNAATARRAAKAPFGINSPRSLCFGVETSPRCVIAGGCPPLDTRSDKLGLSKAGTGEQP
jgi:hypothetical protein